MPEEGEGQQTYQIRLSEEFSIGLSQIWSKRVLDHIKRLIALLQVQPELGSPDVRPSLLRMYGPHLRKLTVSTFVIVYRFDGKTVDVLAIVHGPQVI